jgi:hypothetical protein
MENALQSPVALYWIITLAALLVGLALGAAARAGLGIARIVAALLGGALVALIVDGFRRGDVVQQLEVLLAMPMGMITLADLFLSFILFTVLIFVVERPLWKALLIALPIFALGNVWTALWLGWRLPELAARLRASPQDPKPAPLPDQASDPATS